MTSRIYVDCTTSRTMRKRPEQCHKRLPNKTKKTKWHCAITRILIRSLPTQVAYPLDRKLPCSGRRPQEGQAKGILDKPMLMQVQTKYKNIFEAKDPQKRPVISGRWLQHFIKLLASFAESVQGFRVQCSGRIS